MDILPANRGVLQARWPKLLPLLAAAVPDADAGPGEGPAPLPPAADGLMLAAGTGALGPAGRDWLSRAGACTHLAILAPEPARLAGVLNRRDCAGILADPRVSLCVAGMGTDTFAFLGEVSFAEIERLEAAPAGGGPGYAQFYRMLEEAFAGACSNFHTNILESGKLQRNIFAQLERVFEPDAGQLAGAGGGAGCVIVGAGPSLDASMDFLRAVAPQALVLCGNSAFAALRAHGIEPDLAVAIDPNEHTRIGFGEGSPGRSCLVAPAYVHPAVPPLFAGRSFIWNSQHSLIPALRQAVGLPAATGIFERGTVTASMLDLARLLGCGRMALVGMDMALGADGRLHAGGTFYDEQAGAGFLAEEQPLRAIPGNAGSPVQTTLRLLNYLRIIEELFAKGGIPPAVNTATRGAAINGAPYRDFSRARAWLAEAPPLDRTAWQARTQQALGTAPRVSTGSLLAALEPVESFAAGLLKRAAHAMLDGGLLPRKLQAASYARHREVARVTAHAERINGFIDTHPAAWQILFEGELKRCLVAYAQAARRIRMPAAHAQNIAQNGEYYAALVEASAGFLDVLRGLRGRLEATPAAAAS